MKNFLAGVAVGVTLAAATATAAEVLGGGYLMGWTVEVDGETVCSSPFIWNALKEIDC